MKNNFGNTCVMAEFDYFKTQNKKSMNYRRKFLKQGTLGSSAALFVPYLLWARPDELVGANDRIRVGLIGCNGMDFQTCRHLCVTPRLR